MAQSWIDRYIDAWKPPQRPHCSNCVNARVSGAPDDPKARCVAGVGARMDLSRLVRWKQPCGFAAANKCEHWEAAG